MLGEVLEEVQVGKKRCIGDGKGRERRTAEAEVIRKNEAKESAVHLRSSKAAKREAHEGGN